MLLASLAFGEAELLVGSDARLATSFVAAPESERPAQDAVEGLNTSNSEIAHEDNAGESHRTPAQADASAHRTVFEAQSRRDGLEVAGADEERRRSRPPRRSRSQRHLRSGRWRSGVGAEGGARARGGLRRYLSRPLAPSARHLDHGVLELAVATGAPEIYRLSVGVGVLDHLSLGTSVHWLPRQPRPQWAPWARLALFRTRHVEAGIGYRWLLFAPPPSEEVRSESERRAELPYYQRRAHLFLGSASFSKGIISAGFDAGWIHRRVPVRDQFDPDPHLFTRENQLAGALHVRVGTRRFGVSAMVALPERLIELVFDLRLGLFETREAPTRWRATR